MVYIADVLDVGLLQTMVDLGYVRVQKHPELPLSIYNYSSACQVDRVWNDVTTTCRGLIAHADGTVLARPYAKFFNHGEPEAAHIDLNEPVSVTDKADGSLGILYPTPDGYAVATRGSFASEQALHATDVWRTRYARTAKIPAWMTVLCEIVYPANRIVLDYGNLDGLVLHGCVDIESGRSYGHEVVDYWPGPRIENMGHASFAAALAAEPRPNREGLVVHFLRSDQRVQLKQEWYLRLHRIVTGLNTKAVWEHLAADKPLLELVQPLPDEFHTWVFSVAEELTSDVARLAREVEAVHSLVVAGLPEGWARKDYALAVKDRPQSACLFRKLDGRDYTPILWKQVEPKGLVRPGSAPSDEE